MAKKPELVEMAMGAGLSEEAANAMTIAELEEYLAGASSAGDADANAAEAAAEDEEEDEKPKAKKGAKLDIVRQDGATWWCPNCDHSNYDLDTCGKCGAVKKGNHVTVAA